MAQYTQPADIARETLKALAARKLNATPDNYAQVYQEISGQPLGSGGAESILIGLAQRLTQESPKTTAIGKSLKQAIASRDWSRCQNELQQYLFPPNEEVQSAPQWSEMIRDLLRQLEATHKGLTLSRKKEGLDIVLARFAADPNALYEKLQALVRSWSGSGSGNTPTESAVPASGENAPAPAMPPATASVTTPLDESHHLMLGQLGELLAQSLESIKPAQPELSDEITLLTQHIRSARSHDQINTLGETLHHFWLKVALHGEERDKVQEGLVRLLRLLVENVSELVADDKWLHGQIAALQEIIAHPVDKRSIADAERSLRDAVIKQGLLQQSLSEAKTTLKTLMSSFIDNLGELTDSTSDYHNKIESYSRQIVGTDNLAELGIILDDIMRDTRTLQQSAQRSHEELVSTRKKAEEAEQRVRELELELEEVSEKVREDQLTGALNRRGLDEVLEREFKRADRNPTPVCLALLDLDNFKRLNDTLGHQAGDRALVHLVAVVKEALRPSDSVGRYGGEEFLIVLPDTSLEEGVATISRLQRELTKRFFMHDNQRQLITFSAGVALRHEAESQDDALARADKAMYVAKQTGKNRVVAAE